MKKTTLILICFVVSLTLSACGSKRACANSNEPVVNPIMPVYYKPMQNIPDLWRNKSDCLPLQHDFKSLVDGIRFDHYVEFASKVSNR